MKVKTKEEFNKRVLHILESDYAEIPDVKEFARENPKLNLYTDTKSRVFLIKRNPKFNFAVFAYHNIERTTLNIGNKDHHGNVCHIGMFAKKEPAIIHSDFCQFRHGLANSEMYLNLSVFLSLLSGNEAVTLQGASFFWSFDFLYRIEVNKTRKNILVICEKANYKQTRSLEDVYSFVNQVTNDERGNDPIIRKKEAHDFLNNR